MIITVIRAEIEADAGWAVGTADTEAIGLDRELLTDPSGRPWVPPSSLAGSLRAHLASHDADERLMGSRAPDPGQRESSDPPPRLHPSALWLLGTRARRPGVSNPAGGDGSPGGTVAPGSGAESGQPPPRTEVVASTAVDPVRRAALPQSLRHSRIVDEQTVIDLYGILEGELSARDKELLATWQPQIGRDRTRGAGTATLRSLGYRTYDLARPPDLRSWLEVAGPDRFRALTPIPIVRTPQPPVLEADFRIAAALHVGTGSRRDKTDAASHTDTESRRERVATVRERGNRPLMPASTWKGLFRSRARYIIRTCWGEDAACKTQPGCGNCPLCDLFGYAGKRGRLGFRDSIITGSRHEKRNHVAIDRISGGGRDKLLFTDEVVTAGEMKLTITSLGPVAEWERTLLLHVIRDIHDSLVGVGGGAQRGQGTLRLAAASHPALTALPPMPAQQPSAEPAHD